MDSCIYACMYSCSSSMHVCMYAYMHVCMHACIHVCKYVCMCVYVYKYVLFKNYGGTPREPLSGKYSVLVKPDFANVLFLYGLTLLMYCSCKSGLRQTIIFVSPDFAEVLFL